MILPTIPPLLGGRWCLGMMMALIFFLSQFNETSSQLAGFPRRFPRLARLESQDGCESWLSPIEQDGEMKRNPRGLMSDDGLLCCCWLETGADEILIPTSTSCRLRNGFNFYGFNYTFNWSKWGNGGICDRCVLFVISQIWRNSWNPSCDTNDTNAEHNLTHNFLFIIVSGNFKRFNGKSSILT